MKRKDEAREWLDMRCGRFMNVETHMVNTSTTPLVNEGLLSKRGISNPEIAAAWKAPILPGTCTKWERFHTTWAIFLRTSMFKSEPNLPNSSK